MNDQYAAARQGTAPGPSARPQKECEPSSQLRSKQLVACEDIAATEQSPVGGGELRVQRGQLLMSADQVLRRPVPVVTATRGGHRCRRRGIFPRAGCRKQKSCLGP